MFPATFAVSTAGRLDTVTDMANSTPRRGSLAAAEGRDHALTHSVRINTGGGTPPIDIILAFPRDGNSSMASSERKPTTTLDL